MEIIGLLRGFYILWRYMILYFMEIYDDIYKHAYSIPFPLAENI